MRYLVVFIIGFYIACAGGGAKNSISSDEQLGNDQEIVRSNYQSVLDSNGVIGSVLIYDLAKRTYFSNDFQWANKGHLPASTYKIPNTIIGIETQVIESDSTIFIWDGQARWSSVWEQDLLLKDAFRLSCVPCYQEVARDIGVDLMIKNLDKLNYGHMIVDSTSIDEFWLVGDSQISQMEQIDFLKRLYLSQLPIAKNTENIIKEMLVMDESEQYTLYGKTGLSNDNDHYNGWFVGYLTSKNKTLLFATNIEPKDQQKRSGFAQKRKEITLLLLGLQMK